MSLRRVLALAPIIGGAVLGGQALLASKRTYLSADSAPPLEGEFTALVPQVTHRITIAMLGESTAAGVGATTTEGSVGGQLCRKLAGNGVSTRLVSVAISGSRSRDLGPQVSRALLSSPDIAVILIGANDAMKASPHSQVSDSLLEAINRLHEAGIDVVVGTCPDLSTALSFMEPLRSIVGANGRKVAERQAKICQAAGAVAVDLATETGPTIKSDPLRYLSIDRLHPSDDGYELFAEALLEPVLHLAMLGETVAP